MSRPIVAVVGRPNVGKSTLFNRLAGERISIVQDTPGVTRDRIYADVEWLDRKFTLIDTGGMEIGSEEVIQKQIVQQAQIAIETADVILFVTDVKTGVTEDDVKVANLLRRTKKPVVLAVNKVDSVKRDTLAIYEFYELGIGDPLPVSAGQAWAWAICLTRLSRISLKRTSMRRMMMPLRLPSLGSPMWANPLSSIRFSVRTD